MSIPRVRLWRLPVVAVCATLLSCAQTQDEPVAVEARENLPRVRVITVTERRFSNEFRGFGTIAQRRSTDITGEVEGQILRMFVDEGSRVAIGTPIARIDDFQLRVSLDQANAELESASAQLALAEQRIADGRRAVEAELIAIDKARESMHEQEARLERSRERLADQDQLLVVGGTTEEAYTEAQSSVRSAEAQLRQAELDVALQRIGYRDRDIRAAGRVVPSDEAERIEALIEINTASLVAERLVAEARTSVNEAEIRRIEAFLDRTIVRSPVAGLVAVRHVEEGEQVDSRTPLVTIFNIEDVYVMVDLPERDIGTVSIGQSAVVRHSDRDLERAGVVSLITPFVAPDTRTVTVRLLMENADGAFVPGMFVETVIERGGTFSTTAVPSGAVVDEGAEGPRVFVVRSVAVFAQPVEVGAVEDGWRAVLDGLEPGDRVVEDAGTGFRDGTRITPIEER